MSLLPSSCSLHRRHDHFCFPLLSMSLYLINMCTLLFVDLYVYFMFYSLTLFHSRLMVTYVAPDSFSIMHMRDVFCAGVNG